MLGVTIIILLFSILFNHSLGFLYSSDVDFTEKKYCDVKSDFYSWTYDDSSVSESNGYSNDCITSSPIYVDVGSVIKVHVYMKITPEHSVSVILTDILTRSLLDNKAYNVARTEYLPGWSTIEIFIKVRTLARITLVCHDLDSKIIIVDTVRRLPSSETRESNNDLTSTALFVNKLSTFDIVEDERSILQRKESDELKSLELDLDGLWDSDDEAFEGSDDVATGDSDAEATGNSDDVATGDSDDEATGDSDDEASGDSGDGASGDDEDEASGDNGDGASGDNEDGASGDSEDEASGESGDGASGDNEDEASGDGEDEASGDNGEEASGDSEEDESSENVQPSEAEPSFWDENQLAILIGVGCGVIVIAFVSVGCYYLGKRRKQPELLDDLIEEPPRTVIIPRVKDVTATSFN